jgi:hypothetical protein
MELKRADTLDADWPFAEKDGNQIPLKFDAVVSNPPNIKLLPANYDMNPLKLDVSPHLNNYTRPYYYFFN